MSANPELSIFKSKGVIVGLSASAFARMKWKEKGKCHHVGDGLIAVVGCRVRNTKKVMQDLNHDRLNVIRRWIFMFIAGNLSRDAKIDLPTSI